MIDFNINVHNNGQNAITGIFKLLLLLLWPHLQKYGVIEKARKLSLKKQEIRDYNRNVHCIVNKMLGITRISHFD